MMNDAQYAAYLESFRSFLHAMNDCPYVISANRRDALRLLFDDEDLETVVAALDQLLAEERFDADDWQGVRDELAALLDS